MEGNLEAAVEQLLNVDKQMRLAGDVAGTTNAVTDILHLCFDAKAWKTLNDQIVLLSKRRGQLKQIYVEIERARLVKKLAMIKEEHGCIAANGTSLFPNR